ncbi:Hypothetical predicted protein [Mytilus galloprovincialis]|uniref:Reverse transcriptase domain-containing protein n=1 Tax=Mytilus galloprovincialis TaxID=29158 RepID=A0A8B6EMN8_MYTGA|nr:Hypothetical predicted protein [Mytilus galloprovincialis]
MEEYKPFMSDGFVSIVDDTTLQPIKILRDTGASQSLLLEGVLPLSEKTSVGASVLLQGVELGCIDVPLHRIYLKSDLITGPVVVGVRPNLPVEGVTLLLGNDLARNKVVAEPIVTSEPVVDVKSPEDDAELYPACVVTRAMARKQQNENLQEDKFDYMDLSDTFIADIEDPGNSEKAIIKPPSVNKNVIMPWPDVNSHSLDRKNLLEEQHKDPEVKRVQLSYPKVDDLVGIIKDKGGKCLVFKKDLKRAYRQIPIDPGDLHLVGFQWDNKLFADRVLPMGLRSSALICQRITTAVSFMFYKMGYMVINYLDDFGGADTVDKADEAYIALGALLDSCGLEESKQKGVAPTTRMEFLGITVDTVKLTLEVTSDRVLEISLLVQAWLRKKKASLRELQSILGKLHFVSTCVRPGRLFVSRLLLNWLRSAFPSNVVGSGHKIYRKIPVEVQKDLLWWHRFLSSYNGISMMSLEDWSSPDEIFSSDACLEGFGAITSNQYFHAVFPSDITKDQLHINCLELLAIVVAVKIWGKTFCGKKILIFCDNEASVQVINSGSSKDAFMQTCLRELCFIQASFQFEVRARHILGVENRLADYLSRWHCSHKYRELFKSAISVDRYEEVPVLMSDFSFLNNWATIVSASIPKYVSGIDGCTTQAFPGATIGRLTELISSGKVDLISLDFVIVHVGTNNISSSQSVDTIISIFGDLIHKLKKMTFAKLIFTSILPRPVDHMKTGAKVNKVNTELKRLCKRNNLLYCNLYRSFLLDNIPDASLFAPRDGLHLNFAGTELFRKKIINIIKHQSI